MKEKELNLLCQEKNVDGILVTDPYSMRYFSGFSGGEGMLVFTGIKNFLITDSRYTEAAAAESDFIVIEENRIRSRTEILKELAISCDFKKLGVEDGSLTLREYGKIKEALGQVELVPVEDHLEGLRTIKEDWELQRIRRAEAIGDQAFCQILPMLKPGISELEIAAELEYQMKRLGAEALSFETIVASGIHSSMPHAVPTEKKLEQGDFVTMDFGCRYRGYCSDMTRTVVIGKASEEQKKIYHTVLRAQRRGLDVIAAGKTGKEVDAAARRVIEEAGYGKYFGHGLGHSLGLFIHEIPSLSPSSEKVLLPGMVETVEPGIYIPGFGGVRIEDLVVVTEQGCENLTASTKELLEL